MRNARIIFMGTPEFAVPALRMLAARTDVDVVLVVTQPDRPAGRGRKMSPPAIAVAARDLQLPLLQTSTLRDAEARQRLVDLAPDLIVVAAFGLILGKSTLALPPMGCVNLHASLLPRYRGASPIASAIAHGDEATGVSLMRMEAGLDTGPVFAMAREPILPTDTTDVLTARLAGVAAHLLDAHLLDLLSGSLVATPQPEQASLTRPLVKADGWIDWEMPAAQIERQVRAMWPWPRTWTTLPDGTQLQIHRATVADTPPDASATAVRGTLLEGGVVVANHSFLRLERVQLAGGNPLDRRTLASHPMLAARPILGRAGAPAARQPLFIDLPE